jgi:glyoxylase-like metal-dependent hydrolase (beta-lactamase superfamily II)
MNVNVEVLPGAWQVRQDLAPVLCGTYTVIHVLVGDKLVILDTGLPEEEGSVLELIGELGREPNEVAAILNTHGHGDHIGANVALASLTGAPVAIHRDDAFYLLSATQMWGDTPIRTAPPDRVLDDGDVLTFGEHRLEVIHLPGHSPGSVGYFDRERRVLYCGDSIQGRGTVVQHLALYADPDAYGQSLERVSELEIEHLVPDHPYLPLTDSIASGRAVEAFLEVSRAVYEDMDSEIVDTLRAAGKPLSVEEVTLPICEVNGFPTITSMATITVRAHLERLTRQRLTMSEGSGSDARWALV